MKENSVDHGWVFLPQRQMFCVTVSIMQMNVHSKDAGGKGVDVKSFVLMPYRILVGLSQISPFISLSSAD